jgi:hypothetical protein
MQQAVALHPHMLFIAGQVIWIHQTKASAKDESDEWRNPGLTSEGKRWY